MNAATVPGTPLVIAAPSGAGKSTLVAGLMQRVDNITFSISFTTRPPRAGEVDGVAYHFVDESGFRAKIARGEFLEWADVHGRLYGTSRSETEAVLRSGRDLLLDIDVQGAAQLRASGLNAVSIFIVPPDFATLQARLAGRGTEDPASLARRLADARGEVAEYQQFDYLIINDRLDRALDDLVAIVRAARVRSTRLKARVDAILRTFPAIDR